MRIVDVDAVRRNRKTWAWDNAAALAQVRNAALLPALSFSCINLRRHGEKVLTEEIDRLMVEAMVSSDINGGVGWAKGGIFVVVAEAKNGGDDFHFEITLPLAEGDIE